MDNNIIHTSYNLMCSRHRSEQYFGEEVENNTGEKILYFVLKSNILKRENNLSIPF